MTNPIDDMIKALPPPAPPGPMRTDTLDARIIRGLYLHGPCSLATLQTQVTGSNADDWYSAMKRLGPAVSSQAVVMPGRGEAITLLYARGGGIG